MDVERDTATGSQSADDAPAPNIYEHEGPNPIIGLGIAGVLFAVVLLLGAGAIHAGRWLTALHFLGGE